MIQDDSMSTANAPEAASVARSPDCTYFGDVTSGPCAHREPRSSKLGRQQ